VRPERTLIRLDSRRSAAVHPGHQRINQATIRRRSFHIIGKGCSIARSINPRKWLDTLAAKARSRTRSPTSILRSRAASVRLAEVTNTTSSSVTTPLAWSTPPGPSCSSARRIVVHAWTDGPGPVGLPEPIRKPPHELFRRGRIAPLALNVQQQRYTQLRPRIHATRQDFECPGSVEESIGADRALRGAEQLLIHATSVAGVEARHPGTSPDQVWPWDP